MCCIGISANIIPFTEASCELCKFWKEKGQTRKISVEQLQWLRAQNADAQIENDGNLCSKCLFRYYRRDKGTITTNKQSRTNEKKNNIIVLPFSRVGKSKSVCFICKHKNTGLAMVSAKPRVTLFFAAWYSCTDGRLLLQTPPFQ